MIPTIQILVLLLIVISAVAVVAARLKIPPAILLVLTGIMLALVPGLPTVKLAPEFVLLIVLPPLVYSSAVAMSWREFQFNLRPISLLAVGCVLFTTVAAAAVTHWLLGFSWPVGFVLGAIVSPPDAVAPLSIARRMQLPRRLLVILEGEGLANDASALILYRFAITAASASIFSFSHAAATFAAIVCGEILWGIGVGWVILRLRRWVDGPRTEILLSILTPFVAFWPPQYLGGSGVLATVATGLYFSWNGLRLISAATRLQGIFFWDFFVYVIEGMVFLITGLQARALIAEISQNSFHDLAVSAGVITAVVIVARFFWVYPVTYGQWFFAGLFGRARPQIKWQWSFIIAFTGIRGIVSLAAALALPLTTQNGRPFPDRDLILFLTFAVILVTLIGQGLLLPFIVRVLGLENAGRRERHDDALEELRARHRGIEAALAYLDRLAEEQQIPDEILKPLRARHRERLKSVDGRDGDARQKKAVALADEVEFRLIDAERASINQLYRDGKLKDEARRRIERELDLRHARLSNQQGEI